MAITAGGKPYIFGEAGPVVQKCSIELATESFMTVTLTLVVPRVFGANPEALRDLDVADLLSSVAVREALEKQIEEKLRTITFDDQ